MAQSVSMLPYGALKIVSLATPDVNPQPFRPAAGKKWHVIDAWAMENDAVARNGSWCYYVNGALSIYHAPATIASGQTIPINAYPTITGLSFACSPELWPLTLTNSVAMAFNLDALTAGKFIGVYGLVLEYDE